MRIEADFARFVIECMPAALSAYAADGTLIYANPMARNILGLDADEMSSRTSSDSRWQTIHEDGTRFAPEDFPINRTLRSGERHHEVVMGILRPDDTYRWVLINSEPLVRQGENRPTGVVAIFLDVTDRMNLRSQVIEAQKLDAIGKLSGGVAHDFRNLLQAITSSADLLFDSASDRDKRRIDVIREAAARGTELTQQLLAIGRRRLSQPRALDMRDVIDSSVQLFRSVVGDRI
ncbi:MAG TPA: PAS domain S-box protein, partial [Thermoanaerobaculia bacterium]|nr:PAS domain S-box protein [Thermoanaerobaculia bacterium]